MPTTVIIASDLQTAHVSGLVLLSAGLVPNASRIRGGIPAVLAVIEPRRCYTLVT